MHDRALQADRQNRSEDAPAAGPVRLPDIHGSLSSRDSHQPGPMRARGNSGLVRRLHTANAHTNTDANIHIGKLAVRGRKNGDAGERGTGKGKGEDEELLPKPLPFSPLLLFPYLDCFSIVAARHART